MVSKFEQFVQGGYAKELEENGYPAKAAVLRALVQGFRAGGVPEVFSDAAAGPKSDEQPNEELLDIRQIRARIVQALSKVSPEKVFSQAPPTVVNQMLSEAVGKLINQQVGQFIADEVRISDLVLPSSRRSLKNTGFEGINQVDERVRETYRNSVTRLSKHSIGEVRNASLDEMRSWRGIGDITSYFAKTAFARPQPPERQA